ncbi:MAG: hypothetical protein NE334_11505 [Lentisphaeraceae bacterium]|nr:hypothetical protein [Lentisphaeraceae bacterium]
MALLDFNQQYRNLPSRLLSALDSGKMGQSYIFSGDSIPELKTFVHDWVMAVVCGARTSEGACGECRNCRLVISENYSELYTLEPASKSRTILVSELRAFQNRFYYKSDAKMKKVGLIIEAERMQVAAQNAFLKTLEEPPEDTIFILVTTRVDALLNTIKSRCRLVSMVENKVDYDSQLSDLVIPLLQDVKGKDGAGKALESCDTLKVIFSSLKKKAQDEIEALADTIKIDEDDPAQRKKLKEKIVVMTEGRYRLYREQVLSLIEVWMSQNYMLVSGVNETSLPHSGWVSTTWDMSTEETAKALDEISTLRADLTGNVNEELALENFFLQICQK